MLREEPNARALGDVTPAPDAPCLQTDLLASIACAVLDSLRRGLLVLDAQGRIELANESGRDLLESGDPFSGQPGAQLRIAHRGSQARMEKFLGDPGSTAGPLSMVLHRCHSVAPIAAVFSWLAMGPAAGSRCLVTCFDPSGNNTPATHLLQELYGVTPAQGRVVELLYRGLGVPEISASLNCSVHTVRAHLKGAFRRCAVNSQAELVRLLASMPRLG